MASAPTGDVTILLAVDHADARAWLDANQQPGKVIIGTLRSTHNIRGWNAHRVISTPALAAHPRHDDLSAEALPALAWRSRTHT